MNSSFAGAITHLVAIAAQSLGWRPDEFWRATPADLANALKAPAENSSGMDRDELNSLLEGERHG